MWNVRNTNKNHEKSTYLRFTVRLLLYCNNMLPLFLYEWLSVCNIYDSNILYGFLTFKSCGCNDLPGDK